MPGGITQVPGVGGVRIQLPAPVLTRVKECAIGGVFREPRGQKQSINGVKAEMRQDDNDIGIRSKSGRSNITGTFAAAIKKARIFWREDKKHGRVIVGEEQF